MGLMGIFFRVFIKQLYARRAAEIVGVSVMLAAMAKRLLLGFDDDITRHWTNRLRIVERRWVNGWRIAMMMVMMFVIVMVVHNPSFTTVLFVKTARL